MSDTTVTPPASPGVPLAGRDYRDPATLTQWLKILLILSLLLDFIATVSGVMEFGLLRSFQSGTFDGDVTEAATANDTRQ